MKTAIASLEERLFDWSSPDKAKYELGACLGLWPEMGAPIGEDPFHNLGFYVKNSSKYEKILDILVDQGVLEARWINQDDYEYRFNPNFKLFLDETIKKENLKAFV